MKTEKEEAEEEPFVIRPYLKSELAHKYNPHLPLIYAMQKLRGWIRNNKELYDAMYSGCLLYTSTVLDTRTDE